MKQILTILLLLVYSFSSIGATVKSHLCAGKVQKCFCGKATKNKATKKDTCCTEQTTFVKKQDLHQSSDQPVSKQPIMLATYPVALNTPLTVPVLQKLNQVQLHSKKGILFTGPPIYALDCLYLI